MELSVKWGKTVLSLTIDEPATFHVGELKQELLLLTEVYPERQKLLCKGKNLKDNDFVSEIKGPIILLGAKESDLQAVLAPPDVDDVIDDLDGKDGSGNGVFFNTADDLKKIDRRMQVIDTIIEVKEPPREGKKLLVLDIDYTLFDHRTPAETAWELRRPYLHEFLTAVYPYYDICLWSATSKKWIDIKMRELGVFDHPDYKVSLILDIRAMISIYREPYGVVNCKPLEVIWRKYTQYTKANTIMFDDLRRNFLMNPQSGLRIRPFKNAHISRETDTELLRLTKYLLLLDQEESFETLDHKHWESYCKRKDKEEMS
eukprot:GEMP01022378.1.p1 GENE.GEMP01022378.1~~GEMP01022378.1.p1  ORF type:complete len:316 (+),score=64.16 GEMP01022378.1:52-999(+)